MAVTAKAEILTLSQTIDQRDRYEVRKVIDQAMMTGSSVCSYPSDHPELRHSIKVTFTGVWSVTITPGARAEETRRLEEVEVIKLVVQFLAAKREAEKYRKVAKSTMNELMDLVYAPVTVANKSAVK